MKLNGISDNPGSSKKRTRVGRGIGSGSGKQSGRGGKGGPDGRAFALVPVVAQPDDAGNVDGIENLPGPVG